MTGGPEHHAARLYADASQGDGQAAELLLESYLPRLRAFVRARLCADLRTRESDSDIVQSVCREFLRHRDSFRYQGETQFRGWLFTATANKVQEKIRFHRQPKRTCERERAGNETLAAVEADSAVRPSQAAMARERVVILEAALDSLSETDREVITLARLAELPMTEVASRLGKSVVATRRQLGRALLRLCEALGRPVSAHP